MKSVLTTAVVLATVLPLSARADTPSTSDSFAWLEGDWARETRRGLATETWKRVSPHTLEGTGRVTSGDQTTVTEYLRLDRFGDEVFFTAKPHQNALPTSFKLIESEAARFVFENPGHDFPQRIIYMPQADDALLVRIEGLMDGEIQSVDFNFRRQRPAVADEATEHTRQLEPGSTSPEADFDQIAWLVGNWEGEAFGGRVEERWAPASGGTMAGTFKLITDDQPAFYEFMLLTSEANTLTMKLKHFNADFTGWEAKEDFVSFPLVEIEDDVATFAGLTYRRLGPDRMVVHVAIHQEGGVQEGELFFHRVP